MTVPSTQYLVPSCEFVRQRFIPFHGTTERRAFSGCVLPILPTPAIYVPAIYVLTCNTGVKLVHRRESSLGVMVAATSKFLPQRSPFGCAQGRLRTRGKACLVVVIVCVLGSALGLAQSQELPDAPGESKKKEQTGNPVEVVADKTKDAATAGLKKAREWESGWITGEYVGRNRTLVTLTREQREDIYFRQTLTTPGAYMKRMFGALIDQARGTPSQWDDGWMGYGERFASREGQFIAANTLAALGNAKLGYEVRYDKCKCDGLWRRTRHAIVRNFVTYDRSEERLRPQLGLYGGAFGGGMISAAWKPGSRNPFAEGGYGALGQVAWGTVLNFFTEFSREINRKQGVR